MNQPQRIILMGLKQMECFIGYPNNEFTWLGETFNCVPNTPTLTSEPFAVGYSIEELFSFEVRLNQFTPGIYPQLNDYIQYNGNNLMITSIKPCAHGVSYIYYCKIPTAVLPQV